MFAPLVAEPIGVPSECLLLKNMFDPATEVCLIPFPLDVVAHLYLCVCIFWNMLLLELLIMSQEDPEFDLDIKEDVHEECSNYGRVKHIHVDK